jgi:glucan phosphorylase
MDKNDRRKVVPRVCIIGGKAAPGYEIAKKIIKLCHAAAEKINNDADIGDLLKLVSCKFCSLNFFLQNITVLSICLPFSDTTDLFSVFIMFVLAYLLFY